MDDETEDTRGPVRGREWLSVLGYAALLVVIFYVACLVVLLLLDGDIGPGFMGPGDQGSRYRDGAGDSVRRRAAQSIVMAPYSRSRSVPMIPSTWRP